MKKKVISVMLTLAMTASLVPQMVVSAADEGVTVELNPANASPFNNGEFEGWGTSMGWWGNRIGYSDILAEKSAELFYSEDGLSLDIVRYNVGGGDDPTHNHITRSDSKLPCFAVPQFEEDGTTLKKDENGDVVYDYNWDNDYNQVNVLKKIKAANDDVHIEGYTNSPPWFMTKSGCSGGGTDAGENLDPENYDIFAEFLGDVTEHFAAEGLKFDSYSPMNEPNPTTKYWGALSPKQEGNHVAQGENQSGLINALSAVYDERNIDTLVVGLDETSIDYSIASFAALNETAKANLDRLDTHTYGGSKRAQLKQAAIDGGKNLWMSEVDGSWDEFGIADRIITDLNGMQASAWILWDIVDFHKDSNFTDPSGNKTEANASMSPDGKMWGMAMANHDTGEIELSQKYYGFGQFTRYIKPGMTLIGSASNMLAAYDKKTGEIVVVAVNNSSNSVKTTFDLDAFSKVGATVQPIRTSGAFATGEHWAELDTIAVTADKKFTAELKADSITTFVIAGDGTPVDYMTLSGSGTIVAGMEYEYQAFNSDGSAATVTWSVSDDTVAAVTADGKVMATKGGEFTLKATKEDGTFTAMDVTVISQDGVITIANKKSGLGLETRGKGINSGTQLVQWEYRGLDTSAWKLAPTDDAHYNIIKQNAGTLLASNSEQKPVISSEIEATDDNAKWDLINHGGYYEVKNVATEKSLNVSGESTSNGGNVILYAYGGGDNELWSLGEITGELEHVVPVVVDYSEKYENTDYTFVENIDSLTNDFTDDLKGFVTDGFAGLGTDSNGESVLMPQNSLANSSNKQRAGSATLTLTEPVTCEDTQMINLAFDMYTANSAGDSDFALYASNGAELVSIKSSNYGNDYVIKINGESVGSGSDGQTYFMNNQTGNSNAITSGGHVEIYYTPSMGDVTVTVKNVTNSAAMKTYTGYVSTGLNIAKVYFAGTYTAWNKQMLVDNLVANVVIEPEANRTLKEAAASISIPSTVTEDLDLAADTAIYEFNATDDGVSYKYTTAPTLEAYDKYFAVYKEGTLVAVTKNENEGNLSGNFENCTPKLMIWDGIEPKCDAVTEITDEVCVTWTSSNTDAITNDGVVTRGESDKIVKLTGTFTYGDKTLVKEYFVTVKGLSTGEEEESDMSAYLFVHFVGTESNADCEQIYFSVSKDGTNWRTINNNAPILRSTVGEMGVRDPHIVRSPEGDKFFLIATDLSIYNRRDDSNRWGTCQTSGSKSIVIWESEDLVNWSEARLVKVAVDNAGCTWAPESIYDSEKQAYMVFWASKVSDDNYGIQRVYRSYTTDFVTFTEPEVYIEDTVSNIDTTFIKEDDTYYRFTKNEHNSSIIMEKSASLDGPFEDVTTYTINGSAGNTVTGYEGPTAYKLNGENKWCLLLDYYSKSGGYKPFVTSDISSGMFTSAADFNFDSTYRHGTVMPITDTEYDALIARYTTVEEAESGEMIFSLNFDNENAEPTLGKATVNGEVTYADGYSGKSAVLDSTDYIELLNADEGSLLAGLDTFTVSFASKTNSQSWWFYAAPNTNAQTYKSEKYVGVLDSGSGLTCERYNSNNIDRPASATASYTSGEWKHVTVVYRKNSYEVYIDGVLTSTMSTTVSLNEMLGETPIAYIGKANWVNGEYANGMVDEIKVYNYALGEAEVAEKYAEITK